jgi:citrate lyase subunit beta / citryl-CoA lyase
MSAPRPALRSLLFVPGTRPDKTANVWRSRPDIAVVDLEDAVPPNEKDRARDLAIDGIGRLVAERRRQPVYLRINDRRTPWFAADVAAAVRSNCAGVVLPKVEEPADIDELADALIDNGNAELPIIAGIETVAGVMCAEALCDHHPDAVYFGAEDFVADLGGVRTGDGFEVLYARSKVSLAARHAGIPAIDHATLDIASTDACAADAVRGKALGYRGKLCVHPSQVAVTNRVFGSTTPEISHARRVVHARRARSVLGLGGDG